MRSTILVLLAFPVFAQSVLTMSGPPSTRPGQPVTLDVTLSGAALPAGVQWTAAMPQGVTATAATGPALGTVKELHCGSGAATCLVVGMNTSPIPSGIMARYTVQPGAAKGVYQVPLTGLVAASAVGDVMSIVSGPVYSLRILALSDINGDGVTSKADFDLIVDQVLGRRPCANDQSGDGKCDLLDVLAVIQGALND